jgi:ADP-ribose pyrophosphatase
MTREGALRSDVVYVGQKITVHRDEVVFGDGSRGRREVVRHPGAVAVVPVLGDGRIVLLEHWRHAVGKTLIEIPAGTLEAAEDPLDCAHRELAEETGYRAGSMRPLAVFHTAPGFCDERLHLYVARDLVPGDQNLDPGEELVPWLAEPAQIRRLMRDGAIEDAKTLVGLLMVLGPGESSDG